MNTKFTVVASTANQKGGFVWKLTANQEVTVFGVKKLISRTYYIGGMPSAAAIGAVIEEDMAKFDVIEREFQFPNKDTGEVETINLKWLHAKAM